MCRRRVDPHRLNRRPVRLADTSTSGDSPHRFTLCRRRTKCDTLVGEKFRSARPAALVSGRHEGATGARRHQTRCRGGCRASGHADATHAGSEFERENAKSLRFSYCRPHLHIAKPIRQKHAELCARDGTLSPIRGGRSPSRMPAPRWRPAMSQLPATRQHPRPLVDRAAPVAISAHPPLPQTGFRLADCDRIPQNLAESCRNRQKRGQKVYTFDSCFFPFLVIQRTIRVSPSLRGRNRGSAARGAKPPARRAVSVPVGRSEIAPPVVVADIRDGQVAWLGAWPRTGFSPTDLASDFLDFTPARRIEILASADRALGGVGSRLVIFALLHVRGMSKRWEVNDVRH